MLENINNSCIIPWSEHSVVCYGYIRVNNNKQVTVCLTGARLFLIAQW